MKYYNGFIDSLPKDCIFVFGSNTEGRHGKGSALIAKEKFGAIYGQSSGLQGQSYAIITKDLKSKKQPSRTPEQIKEQIHKLYEFAQIHRELKFYIAYTTINGDNNLNYYSNKDLAKIFASFDLIPSNIYFEKGFYDLVDSFRKKEIIVIINGSRDFDDYSFLEEKCYEILTPYFEKGIDIIIREGNARGCDRLAAKFAHENNLKLQVYIPDWSTKYGGLERNIDMIKGKDGDKPADIMISFNMGTPGTIHAIKWMRENTVFTSIYEIKISKI